jgi:hypothetical protein
MLCRLLCALLFVGWTAEWPLETDPILYNGLWRSPFEILGPAFVSVPGVFLFPWQLALIALAPLCLLWPGAFRARSAFLDGAIVTSLASVAVTFLWGLLRGGSAYNAYYQLWRFLVALLFGLLLASVIRRPADVRALGLTLLLAALVRGSLAIYFYWYIVQGRIDPPPPYMTNHDDTLLFVAGVLVPLCWALVRRSFLVWVFTVLVGALLLYAIVLNDRRLAWVELVLVIALACALPRGKARRRMLELSLVASPLLLLYTLVGWGRPEPIFEPLRAFAAVSGNEDLSALARQEEVRNLLFTLSANGNPLLGTGWGVPYQKLTSLYANFGAEWWQYLYLPHNSLLGVAVFGGLLGICGIWLVVPVTAFLAAQGYHGALHPAARAGAMAALSILPAYGAQCYGDVGFQSLTGNLILGVALGVASKVSVWATPARRGARA